MSARAATVLWAGHGPQSGPPLGSGRSRLHWGPEAASVLALVPARGTESPRVLMPLPPGAGWGRLTHLLSLGAGGALRAGEAAVALLALLAWRPDESDQAWVTLWERRREDSGRGRASGPMWGSETGATPRAPHHGHHATGATS